MNHLVQQFIDDLSSLIEITRKQIASCQDPDDLIDEYKQYSS